ncbi:MAG: cold shock and DUF1294 domain-containing protein [Planctomycetota bacterium]|nr:cold shock and DUF1294 domain-containing protein [Planctomycetota bacterium]
MRHQGRITNWKDDKGFGFITPDAGGRAVFVHISAFSNRNRRPTENDTVTFRPDTDPQGRPRAAEVEFVGETPQFTPEQKSLRGAIAVATVFLAIVAVLVVLKKIHALVLGLYGVASIVTFCAYGFDKSAARKGNWRTAETTLHLFGLVGGWPGALVAQKLFRHKTSKHSFQITYWITVIINCGVFAWLVSSESSR